MIKMIALDMDGTLLNDKKVISSGNLIAIEKAKAMGVKVVLASGRPIQGLKPHLNNLGLNSSDDYVISYNGSLVQCVGTGQVIHKTSLKGFDAKSLFTLSKQLGVFIHAFSVDRGLIVHEHNEWTDLEARINGIQATQVDFDSIDDNEDIIKVMMIADEKTLSNAIHNLPQGLKQQYTVVRSAPFFLELLHLNSNKGIAVDKLAQLLAIKTAEVMCVGDAENDHAMLNIAGIAVAMENADKETKSLANFITTSNNEDGVARAITDKVLSAE